MAHSAHVTRPKADLACRICYTHSSCVGTRQAVEAELAGVRVRTEAALQHANSGKAAYLKLLNLQVRPEACDCHADGSRQLTL